MSKSFREKEGPKSGKIVKTHKEYGGTWTAYCRYLVSEGGASPNLGSIEKNLPAKTERRTPAPWFGKNWTDMDESMRQQIRIHIGELSQTHGKIRALDYCRFLYDKAGVPNDLANQVFS